MTKKCAWCNKYLGEMDGEGVDGISHGICSVCDQKLSDDWDEQLEQDKVSRIKDYLLCQGFS